MIAAVADTHTVIWYLANNPRLSPPARHAIEDAAAIGSYIAVSSITLIEMIYLQEKSRIPGHVYALLTAALADKHHVFLEAPVTAHLSGYLSLVSRIEVPDMPDRIIAATGIQLRVPVISRDRQIRAANLTSIW